MVMQSLKSAYKKFHCTFTSLLLGRTPHKQMADPHVCAQTHGHINCVNTFTLMMFFAVLENSVQQTIWGSSLRFIAISLHWFYHCIH